MSPQFLEKCILITFIYTESMLSKCWNINIILKLKHHILSMGDPAKVQQEVKKEEGDSHEGFTHNSYHNRICDCVLGVFNCYVFVWSHCLESVLKKIQNT